MQEETEELPPLPRYDLKKIFATRKELYIRLWEPLQADIDISGNNYLGMIEEVTESLKLKSNRAVADSIAPLLGTRATDASLWALAWRMAANVNALKAGVPVLPWAIQRTAEWIPLQIASARRDPRRRASGALLPGCTFTLQSLAGSYCPNTLMHWWSKTQGSVVARELGFSPPWGKYPFHDAHQLVGLRLYALFTPESCAGGRAGFFQVACSSSMEEYNRALLSVRCRVTPCPRGYEHACHNCGVGYRNPDGCPYATHPAHFVLKPCPACGVQEAPFDPEGPSGACIKCNTREIYKKD
jgi:hypothetical protein